MTAETENTGFRYRAALDRNALPKSVQRKEIPPFVIAMREIFEAYCRKYELDLGAFDPAEKRHSHPIATVRAVAQAAGIEDERALYGVCASGNRPMAGSELECLIKGMASLNIGYNENELRRLYNITVNLRRGAARDTNGQDIDRWFSF